MARAKSTGARSPVKKSGKTPSRNTTPRKKSKTPSRKSAKSPAKSPVKRARSRSVSKSRATPKKVAAMQAVRKSPGPKRSPSKSPSKASPVAKKATPRGRPHSRSSSQKSTGRRTPTIGQKIKDTAHVIEHKISSPIASLASNLRSRRAAYDSALSRVNTGGYTTSSSNSRRPVTQGIWNSVRNSRAGYFVRSIPRRARFNNIKRHFKKNWRRYAVAALAGFTIYYSYHNKKVIEKALNEQYARLSALVQQQKGSTFSKYFSG